MMYSLFPKEERENQHREILASILTSSLIPLSCVLLKGCGNSNEGHGSGGCGLLLGQGSFIFRTISCN